MVMLILIVVTNSDIANDNGVSNSVSDHKATNHVIYIWTEAINYKTWISEPIIVNWVQHDNICELVQ